MGSLLGGKSPHHDRNCALCSGRMNAIIQASVGEATFQCSGKEGYTYATTLLISPPNPAGVHGWAVYKLAGYTVTDPTHHEMARYVMYKMLGSLTIDKAWDAQYQRKIQDTTGNVIRMQNALTQESSASQTECRRILGEAESSQPGSARTGEK